jgi:MFS family permease
VRIEILEYGGSTMTTAVYSTPQKRADEDIGGAMAWWVWALTVTFVVFLFSFQTGYAIVNSNVQQDIGLSIAQVGTIAAVYTWAFAICQFFGGALLDRLGSRKILPASIAIVTIGIFVFANANSYATLLLSQIIVAIGSCTGFVGAGYVGGKWFGMAKFSFMFGLVQVVAALTSAFSQNLISLGLDAMTWRTLFNGTAAFGIVLFIVGAIYIKNPTPVVSDFRTGVADFFMSVVNGMIEVAKIAHVWIASVMGACTFGAMLALGVVWGPKLLQVHGISESTANFGASMLWLGLAAGSAAVPYWSDKIRQRKMPILVGNVVQLAALAALLFIPEMGAALAMALCFIFGFANAAHMLSFSTAADVVQPSQIGTSAAIVNGIMFIFGGILISRPGARIGLGLEAGYTPKSLEIAQYASIPLIIALVVAIVLAVIMKETYPSNAGGQSS